MKKIILAATAIAGLIGVSTAFAGDNGMYLLGGVGKTIVGDSGQSSVDNVLASSGGGGFSSSMNAPILYKLQVGYQLDQNWALEGGYIGSRNVNYSASGGNLAGTITSSSRINGWNLTTVGALPLANGFSILGKVGLAAMQELATVRAAGFTDSTTGSNIHISYGIGAKYDLSNTVFIRFDMDRYNIGTSAASSNSTVGMIDLGYKF